MENPLKNAYDYASLLNDIKERQDIVNRYIASGYLDRDDAINKIKKLRATDTKILAVTTVGLAVGSVPFEQATNEAIVSELKMQIEILTAEIASKTN